MITIVIPTFNESAGIVNLIRFLKSFGREKISEIIVVDGGSTDNTIELAFAEGVKVLVSPIKSRAAQMNFGASESNGEILYFLHADVKPPENFATLIQNVVQNGYDAGNFTAQFFTKKKLLKLNSWLSKSKLLFFRGGGDLSLFISLQAFQDLKGYNEKYTIMEDFDLVKRIRKSWRFASLSNPISVSARKYQQNAYWKVSMAYVLTYLFFQLGASSQFLAIFYKCLIKNENQESCIKPSQKSKIPIGNFCHTVTNKVA